MNTRSSRSRRSFLKSGLGGIIAAAAAPRFLSSRLFGAQAPSRTITLGFIGVGAHGYGVNLKAFLQEGDCRVLAVCDVLANRREEVKAVVDEHYGTAGCAAIADFRDLLARDDIDAVVISTPDHWHVSMAMMAMKAGKKIFCEKPTLTIAEGRILADEVKRRGAIFATGLEDRSVIHYHKMAEAVRNGAIGELRRIKVGLMVKPIFPLHDPVPVPEGLDFDLWLGPAPERPYTPNLTDAQVWRQIRDFSGGSLTDWGAHLIDTAQVGNFAEDTGPVLVEGVGLIPAKSINTVPQTYELTYTYANGVTLEVVAEGPSIRFEGTKGWVGNKGWRGQLEASDMNVYRRTYDAAANKIWPRPPTEHRNFLDCIHSGEPPTYTAEALHRLSTVLHMGAISMELGKPLRWDPKSELFDDPAANALRSRKSRGNWG